jgi:hypothetical protein
MTSAVLKERKDNSARIDAKTYRSEKVEAFCPRCKTLQTAWLDGNTLATSSKFFRTEDIRTNPNNCCLKYFQYNLVGIIIMESYRNGGTGK